MTTRNWLHRRPRLAYPFTVVTSANVVRLVAGEDFRYTLTAPDLDCWLPTLLEQCTGARALADLVAPLSLAQREAALQVIEHLYGERVLIDGSACDAHPGCRHHVVIEGTGPLVDLLAPSSAESGAAKLVVFCQDRLDYEAALQVSRRCREGRASLLWVSHGAMTRAYVSPLFLPNAGPCFGCLYRSFHRLSPAPEIYDALLDHARQGRPIAPVELPRAGLLILQGIVAWKLAQAEMESPAPALYRLHVLELERLEVSTHRVFRDPLCPDCGQERA